MLKLGTSSTGTTGQDVKTPGQQNGKSGFKREGSRSSIRSTRSAKSSTSNASHIMRKLEEHQLRTSTDEWQKEQEYSVRRKRRKAIQKKMMAKQKLQLVRKFNVVTLLVVLLGVAITFGACVKGLGGGTVLYTYRQYFYIIGPVLTVIGIVFMLVIMATESNILKKMKDEGEFEIDMNRSLVHPDFRAERRKSVRQLRMLNQNSTSSSTGRWYDTQTSIEEEDDFLCDSVASASSFFTPTLQGKTTDFSNRWAKCMTVTFNIDNETNVLNSSGDTNAASAPGAAVANERRESVFTRELHHAPNVNVTEFDVSKADVLQQVDTHDLIVSMIPSDARVNDITTPEIKPD
ncbi:uncharacterized protein LOC128215800 [Mya arenaria]|uniref:uncharacterized protein LOC128215800 n=1 Tax=Mya arenaria TaxID=6604 RepID=UPI0022E6156C|nr:uncharacterized protein LOC128215800 [Mya arenaria]